MNRSLCVVTGATGFIGKHLVRALLGAGHSVRALVREPAALNEITESAESAESAHERLSVVPWTIAEARDRTEVFDGAQLLFHLAAYLPPSYHDPDFASECFRVNTHGTLDLLRAAADSQLSRIIHFSSGNIYSPVRGLVTENASAYPSVRAPYYLSSKLSGEIFADHMRRSHELSVSILRLSAVYGPGMGNSGLIPTFAGRLAAGAPIEVHDGGRYTVDLVHVEDVVSAALLAAKARDDGIFNVGSGVVSTILEVARTMLELFGAQPTAMNVGPVRDGDPPLGFAGLDTGRAGSLLGYAPRSLRAGLRDYLLAEGRIAGLSDSRPEQ